MNVSLAVPLSLLFRTALRRALLSACVALTACSTVPREPIAKRVKCPEGSPTIRIGTYNVFVGSRDLQKTAAVIRTIDADIIALQEVLPQAATGLDREFAREYPYRYFSRGLGLMSRLPLRNIRAERSRLGINGFTFAEVTVGPRRLQFANVHLDPLKLWTIGGIVTLPYQLCCGHQAIQRTELAQIVARLRPGVPTIVAGDFNRTGNQTIEALEKMGYADTLAPFARKPNAIPTLHTRLLGLRLGRRIDYILHDNQFRTLDSRVVPGHPSDHDAVVSVLCWPRRNRQAGTLSLSRFSRSLAHLNHD